jgi:hypothetical protein
MADAAAWAPPESDFKAANAPTWSPPESDFAPPRVGRAEEYLTGPGSLVVNTLANIPHAAAHSAVDLYRRVTGGDTDAPDPAAVSSLQVPLEPAARQLAGDIGAGLRSAFPAYTGPQAPDDTNVQEFAPGTQDFLKNKVLPVVADVANLAPVAGIVKGVAGKVLSTTAEVPKPIPEPVKPATPAAADAPGASEPLKFEAGPPPIATDTAATAAPAPAALPPETQAARAATLKEVGVTNARTSAVEGDAKAAATDFQQSKLDNDGGKVFSDALDGERQALDKYSDNIVANAGGTKGLDETSLHNRGQAIVQPLEDLSDHLDNVTKSLYSAADANAAGKPVDLRSFKDVLNDDSNITNSDRMHLRDGLNSYVKKLKLVDGEGNVSGDVAQAETIRKYLGENWSPQNARYVGKLKDALDDDVTKAAGSDVYQTARAVRAERANLLDNPKGVSSLIDSSGPSGINRAVDYEKVPDKIARMPVDQFGHVVDTLKGMTAELQPKAQAALGEIRSQFLQRMQEQGQAFKSNQWNNKGVTQYLNANSAKLAKVFSPSELQQIKTLNDAGNILSIDRSYGGSAVQGQNLLQRGAIAGVQHGATALGAHIGGPLGAMAGEAVGGMGAKALSGSMSRKAALARFQKL